MYKKECTKKKKKFLNLQSHNNGDKTRVKDS